MGRIPPRTGFARRVNSVVVFAAILVGVVVFVEPTTAGVWRTAALVAIGVVIGLVGVGLEPADRRPDRVVDVTASRVALMSLLGGIAGIVAGAYPVVAYCGLGYAPIRLLADARWLLRNRPLRRHSYFGSVERTGELPTSRRSGGSDSNEGVLLKVQLLTTINF